MPFPLEGGEGDLSQCIVRTKVMHDGNLKVDPSVEVPPDDVIDCDVVGSSCDDDLRQGGCPQE